MFFIVAIGAALLQVSYLMWLAIRKEQPRNGHGDRDVDSVTVVLLTQDGASWIREKLVCLEQEIKTFAKYEIIVIDDHSSDDTIAAVRRTALAGTHLVLKDRARGIPHSMNMGVAMAQYDNIVFCDQRQHINAGCLRKLVDQLKNDDIGAVSSCISEYDKGGRYSFMRALENHVKRRESRFGALIGVYGPLYAVKKECYAAIPEHIILDDLYLTIQILKKKRVIMRDDCKIVDEAFDGLYDFRRSKRYLRGYAQLLRVAGLADLPLADLFMLCWHKLYRSILPLLVCSCLLLGTLLPVVAGSPSHQLIIAMFIACGCLSASLAHFSGRSIKSVIRLCIFYSLAPLVIVVEDALVPPRGDRLRVN